MKQWQTEKDRMCLRVRTGPAGAEKGEGTVETKNERGGTKTKGDSMGMEKND